MTPAQPARREELKLVIHGKADDACFGRTFESQDRYTGTAGARLVDGGPEGIDEAVASARAAFDGGQGAIELTDAITEKRFEEVELAYLIAAITVINAWNRVGVTSRGVLGHYTPPVVTS